MITEIVKELVEHLERVKDVALRKGFNSKAREPPVDPREEGGGKVVADEADLAEAHVDAPSDFLGLDGSSRIIDTNIGTIVLASATVVDGNGRVFLDYPPVSSNYPLRCKKVPFIALASEVAGMGEIRGPITNVSITGKSYAGSYYRDQIAHEIRNLVENAVLDAALGEGRDVLVDGPVYPTPKFVFSRRFGDYREAFLRLIEERLRILNRRERRVIGIVKRLDFGHWLSRSRAVRDLMLKKYGINIRGMSDHLVVQLMAQKEVGSHGPPRRPLFFGPLRLEFGTEGLREKVLYYVMMPSRPYRPLLLNFFRIESLVRDDSVVGRVIASCTPKRLRLPRSILIADRRARALTRDVGRLILSSISRLGIALTYDTMMRWAEVS